MIFRVVLGEIWCECLRKIVCEYELERSAGAVAEFILEDAADSGVGSAQLWTDCLFVPEHIAHIVTINYIMI